MNNKEEIEECNECEHCDCHGHDSISEIKIESETIKKTEDECIEYYTNYINEHLYNVHKAFQELCKLELEEVEQLKSKLENRVKDHDKSKWSMEEFNPYRKNFFPIDNEEKINNKEAFELAWKHHYRNNKHHWQYWLNEEGTDLISRDNVDDEDLKLSYLEMICDWERNGL